MPSLQLIPDVDEPQPNRAFALAEGIVAGQLRAAYLRARLCSASGKFCQKCATFQTNGTKRRLALFALLPIVVLVTALPRRAAADSASGPVELTAAQDRQRALDSLGIKSLRQGVNARDPNAPNVANWDEAKANPYPELPDPLTLNNGQKVTTAKQWREQRRAELFELFDREVYGRAPKDLPGVKWEVSSTANETKSGLPVITKQLVGHVDNSSYPQITVEIEMVLTTPAGPAVPCP